MFEFGTVAIVVAVFVIVFTFLGPQWWFDRVFPDSMDAIRLVRFMAKHSESNRFSPTFDEKRTVLLITWGFLEIIFLADGSGHSHKVAKEGKEFVEKYQNSKFGIRLFVIGKLGRRLLKFVLPFIGANILFVWYKYFENYLEKLFDMCP